MIIIWSTRAIELTSTHAHIHVIGYKAKPL